MFNGKVFWYHESRHGILQETQFLADDTGQCVLIPQDNKEWEWPFAIVFDNFYNIF